MSFVFFWKRVKWSEHGDSWNNTLRLLKLKTKKHIKVDTASVDTGTAPSYRHCLIHFAFMYLWCMSTERERRRCMSTAIFKYFALCGKNCIVQWELSFTVASHRSALIQSPLSIHKSTQTAWPGPPLANPGTLARFSSRSSIAQRIATQWKE